MSEKHNLSRLTGATPGYVGYEEGGDLCNAVRRKPYSVVVFDEIEKAHPDVANILLQILEEGMLTDGQGNKVSLCVWVVSSLLTHSRIQVNFKNTLIVLTSNLGSIEFTKPGATNEDGSVTEATRGAVLSHVRSWFRPELIGRLDEMLIFNSLPRSAINDIVRLRLSEIQDRIADKRIILDVTEKAVDHIALEGYSPQYGAREVARVIRDNIVTKLAHRLLEGTIRNGDTVKIDFKDGKIVVPEIHTRDDKQGENILEIIEEDEEDDAR
jgi:ATP-dependent Clp protease ATP-binding subunit ClpB